MAWFTPAAHPQERYYIFGREGAKMLASELNVPLLGQIPLVADICEQADLGSWLRIRVGRWTFSITLAIVKVLPEPVTPRSTCATSPLSTPRNRPLYRKRSDDQ